MLSIFLRAPLFALLLSLPVLAGQETVKRDIETLSSPGFSGRMAGEEGNRKAAEWIRRQARSAGLLPLPGSHTFAVKGEELQSLFAELESPEDRVFPLPMVTRGMLPDLRAADLRVLPFGEEGNRSPEALRGRWKNEKALLLLPQEGSESFFMRFRSRAMKRSNRLWQLPGDETTLPLFYGNEELAELLDSDHLPEGWKLSLPERDPLAFEGRNLLFRLPWNIEGPLLLLVAHYDHLGASDEGYHPGADDNASGVSTLLELARNLRGRRLPYRLHFLFSDAEEIGLLGSRASLLQEARPDRVINLDTVGRGGVDHYRKLRNPKAASDSLLIVWSNREDPFSHLLLESSSRLQVQEGKGPVFEMASDHHAFSSAGIPSHFLFGGFHLDYHKPGDSAEKVLPWRIVTLAEILESTLDALEENPELIRGTSP
ncbi:MAG: M28 family peptidase [Candidatus Krumholzibacteria bacterium]|jgi:hypothetical protein|nr:M28 family peptidase [Candidatus Krumholzibacteria bacterium]